MNSERKIPTALGLSVIILGLASGIFLLTQKEPLFWQTKAAPTLEPKNLNVVNISDTQASIYWQGDEPASAFIQAGLTPALGVTYKDERDIQKPEKYSLHLITLTNLQPNSVYYYKIYQDSRVYPPGEPLTFKTANPLNPSAVPPLVGTVLDTSGQQQVPEALVTLDIPGAQPLATVTKIMGNFVLPISGLRQASLTQSYNPSASTLQAKLTILSNHTTSTIILPWPPNTTSLPPVTLGQNLDLSTLPVSPTPQALKYDLNGDMVINSLDISLIMKNIGKNPFDPKADLNGDGVVNQKDLEAINKALTQNLR